jgi:hypothetical protein
MMNPLYRQGNSYEKGCGSQSWIRGEWHFPLIAYKFQITIVVYSTSTTRSIHNGGDPVKYTLLFAPDCTNMQLVSNELVNPQTLRVDMASTIFLVHMNSIHYLCLSAFPPPFTVT